MGWSELEASLVQELVAEVPALVAVLDADSCLAGVNSAWNTLLGWQPEELVGEPLALVVHPLDQDSMQLASGLTGAGGSQVCRVRQKDQSYRSFSWTAAGNAESYRMVIGMEVSQQQSSRSNSAPRAERLESFLRTIPGYVVVVDQALTIEYLNRPGPNISAEQVVGTGLLQRIAPENRDTMSVAIASAFAGEHVPEVVFAVSGEDGRPYWYRTSIRAIEHDGEIVSVILYGDELTHQVREERERAQAARFEAVGRVSAAIVHDLNNILMAIGVASQLLSLREQNAENREDIDLLLSVVEQGRELTSHLMVPFRRNAPEAAVIDLVAAVCALEPLLLRTGKGLLAIDIADPGREIFVELPSHEVSQLLLNLVVNAAEAMPGGGCVNIGFNVCEISENGDQELGASDYVTLVVQDNGPGIPYEVRDQVFDPFFTTKTSGSGFGLATCYAIARRYRGQIRLSCPTSGGTRVEVRLPIFEHAGEPPLESREPAQSVEATSLGGRAPVLLLAEDSATTRVALSRYLKRQGYVVLEACNGEHALEVATNHGTPVDVLVTDIIMPQRDGTWLIRELRARQPDLRVLAMSGYALPSQLEELRSMEVKLLAKPVLPSELLEHLARLLSDHD